MTDTMSPAAEPPKESNIRSLLKALSWRIIATLTTMGIAYWYLGSVETALKIGLFEFFAKFFVYYGHERLWQVLPRGTFRKNQEA